MLKQYFSIIVKDNSLFNVSQIDEDKYNYFEYIFNSVYHAKNGDAYPLNENFDGCIAMLIVDGEHLYELLDDLKEQGFCDFENWEVIKCVILIW